MQPPMHWVEPFQAGLRPLFGPRADLCSQLRFPPFGWASQTRTTTYLKWEPKKHVIDEQTKEWPTWSIEWLSSDNSCHLYNGWRMSVSIECHRRLYLPLHTLDFHARISLFLPFAEFLLPFTGCCWLLRTIFWVARWPSPCKDWPDHWGPQLKNCVDRNLHNSSLVNNGPRLWNCWRTTKYSHQNHSPKAPLPIWQVPIPMSEKGLKKEHSLTCYIDDIEAPLSDSRLIEVFAIRN